MAEEIKDTDKLVEMTADDGSTVLLAFSAGNKALISYDGVSWQPIMPDSQNDGWEDYR